MDQDHVKNLYSDDAIQKIKELAEDVNTCMFCTNVTDLPFNTRPMATMKVDEQGNLWFFSSTKSNKNAEIEDDERVQLTYSKTSDNHYLTISGKAMIVKDQGKIDELWSPIVKVWFQGGKEDPQVSLIKVIPEEAYYWDTKHGKMVSLVKIVASLVTGKTMDDSIEGRIKV